jgi:hypothetical protein
MHGGAQGSGARYTKEAIEERRQLRRLIRDADKFLEEFES